MKKVLTDKEATGVLAVYLVGQSMIHQIDRLSDSVMFKHEFKQRSNSYQKFIEKQVDALLKNVDPKEAQSYIDIVAQIDDVVEQLFVKIETE